MSKIDKKIAVTGLGYVGRPLTVEFVKYCPVISVDIKLDQMSERRAGREKKREVSAEELPRRGNCA